MNSHETSHLKKTARAALQSGLFGLAKDECRTKIVRSLSDDEYVVAQTPNLCFLVKKDHRLDAAFRTIATAIQEDGKKPEDYLREFKASLKNRKSS